MYRQHFELDYFEVYVFNVEMPGNLAYFLLWHTQLRTTNNNDTYHTVEA